MDTVTHLAAVAWGIVPTPSGYWWIWLGIGVVGMLMGVFIEDS